MAQRISYREAYDNRSVPVAIANKQDRLTPGHNIAISDDNVISAFGEEIGGYEGGTNIEIDQNVINCTVDTAGFATEAELDTVRTAVDGKQDRLVAGENITINGNVISATGGGGGQSYVAGSGISIENNVISNTAQPDVTKAYVDTALAGKQDFSLLIRRIHIGTAQTPSASLGEDGDLYIYRPTE